MTRRLLRLAVRWRALSRWLVDPQDTSEIEWRAFTP